MRHSYLPPIMFLLLPLPWAAQAVTEKEVFALSLEELAKLEISISTGTLKRLTEAPAVASIITATDLETLGAQELDEALQTVPGLHVSHGGLLYESRYYFRGIFSNSNPHTLVLVNGIPQTSLMVGDRLAGWPGVPVKAIARVEIIRGPGSAVYGADAFAGVINIITKGPADIPGGQASLSHGSFDTTHASLLQSASLGPVQAILSLAYSQTDGDDRLVEAAWQSGFDALFGTQASLAPGPLNLGYKTFNSRAEFTWGAYRLRASWQEARDMETAQGLADALDPQGRFDNHWGDLDFSWHDPALFETWDLEAQLSFAYKALEGDPPAALCCPPAPLAAAFRMAFWMPLCGKKHTHALA